jgi:hypothetical protein
MTGVGVSIWLVAGLLLALLFSLSVVVALLWLRLRRIRLQIEGRYLAGVAEFHGQNAPPTAAEVLERIPGESARRLLQGMIARGYSMGPVSWSARGLLRYDQDARERPVEAETFGIPGQWWAQIRRVRLRYLGWIDEMHQVEAGSVTSGYWWLGLYRLQHPTARSSELALQAQALGEAVLTPWVWFDGQSIAWDEQTEKGIWSGHSRRGGLRVRLQLDPMGRPLYLEVTDPVGGERVRLEYAGWNWSDQGLRPERLRLIEAPGGVNEFQRLELRPGPVRRAPPAANEPAG